MMPRSHIPSAISTAASALSAAANSTLLTPRTPRYIAQDGAARSYHSSQQCLSPSFSRMTPGGINTLRQPRTSRTSIATAADKADSDDELLDSSEITPTERSPFLPRSPALTTPFLVRDASIAADANKLGTFSAINIILGKTIGVGIYSVPSSIFADVGSVGMALLVWVVGAAISFCGLSVYIELGTAMPKSGGEKVYLERIFRKPKFLATCVFMSYVVLLGFSTPNCIVLGEYAMYALNVEASQWNVRTVAVLSVTLACWVHATSPRLGLTTINVLGAIKMMIIALIGVVGVASVAMRTGMKDNDPSTATFAINYGGLFKGSTSQPYAYATALLKALYCFRGYNTANQVLGEVRDPVPTLKKAAPAALSIVTVAYVVTNLAYFAAVERSDIATSGVVVAGHFFRNVCGELVGTHLLPVLIMLSAFGSIAATSFAQARVNQELAKEGLMPFASFFASSRHNGTPAAGLFLHWLVSVLVIVLPPPGEIYAFLVTLGAYPVSVLAVLVSGGLLYLKHTPAERWRSPAPAPRFAVIIFLLANVALIILPWVPLAMCHPTRTSFPSYAYPAGGCGVLAIGAVYWVYWAKLRSAWSRIEDRFIHGAVANADVAEVEWKRAIITVDSPS